MVLGGGSPAQVAAALTGHQHIRAVAGDVLIFSSGHFLRMFATPLVGLDPIAWTTIFF